LEQSILPPGRRALDREVFRPVEIGRARLVQSLADHADMPVRFLCAPVGSGKTTLLRAYAERTPRTRYVEVARGAMWSTLRGAIGSARSASHVVLDGLDDADPAAIDALVAHLLSNVAAFPKLIIAGRARALLPVQNLLARGLAVDFGARDLAFQADEIEALADRLGLTYRDDDVAELLHATEGWAIAVGWILREATYAREGLRGAFERWAERRDRARVPGWS
jgi:ATP/maltotriose-dependent transcriptional regulator MalT